MAAHNVFVTHVLDLLDGLGAATARAMFGGYGIYVEGTIIGLVIDDRLYLKVDDQNRSSFEQAKSVPFTYHNKKSGKDQAMSYWSVPDHVLDDAGAMVEWGRRSLDASLRARAKPTAKPAAKRAGRPPAAKTASVATAGRTATRKRRP